MTKEDKLILEPTNEHKKINDLLANLKEKYILAEFDWGEPVGHEYQVDGEKDCALTQGGLTNTANAMKNYFIYNFLQILYN